MTTRNKAAEAETAHTAASIAQDGQDTAARGFEKTLSTLKDGVERASRGFETSQAKVKENMAKAMKTAEEAMEFGQGNFAAFLKASQVWAAGVQDLSRQATASAQASVDDHMSFTKAIVGVKSVKEAIDLQAAYTRSAVEKAFAETGRFTDASVKLAEQAAAPLTARLTLAVEKFGKAI